VRMVLLMSNHYRRSAAYLYPVRNADTYFHAGRAANGQQVLMGLQLPKMIAIFFDQNGKKVRFQQRAYSRPLGTRADGLYVVDDTVEMQMRDDLKQWEAELGFAKGQIKVRRFSLRSHFIGIRDLPSHYESFLEDPTRFETKRRLEVEKDIDKWL